MPQIAIITDTHFGKSNDHPILLKNAFDFVENVFFPELEKRSITSVIHAGDVGDRRKYVNFNVLHDIRTRFVERLVKTVDDVSIIIGNHDCYFKNTNSVNAVTELFDKYPINIYTGPTEVTIQGIDMLFLPWINPENAKLSNKLIKDSTANMVVGHLEISGFQMDKGIVCKNGLNPEHFHRFLMTLSGHFHHRSMDLSGIKYLGSPYQMTAADADDVRGFHILHTETMELEFISNPHQAFKKIIYDDRNLQEDEIFEQLKGTDKKFLSIQILNKDNPFLYSKFIDQLAITQPAKVSYNDKSYLIGLKEEFGIDEIADPDDIPQILSKFIDTIDIQIDPDELKKYMNSVYDKVMKAE